uniref:Putative secreted protein salivary gland overexpressed n=1 Tax=Rhipicephalus microplus TaxID=6941 RepID=A0A6M2DBH9_RHIMP
MKLPEKCNEYTRYVILFVTCLRIILLCRCWIVHVLVIVKLGRSTLCVVRKRSEENCFQVGLLKLLFICESVCTPSQFLNLNKCRPACQ